MIPPKEKKLFDTIEEKRKMLRQRLSSLNEAILEEMPQNGDWSVLHILKHLITSEKLSMQYLQKKWSFKPTLRKAGILTEIRFMALRYANWTPVKLKAPEPVRIESVDQSYEELMQEWEKIRQAMASFINDLPDEVYSMELYKHPIAGKLTIRHMLTFFRDHIARHEKQIDRLIGIHMVGQA